MEYGIVSLLPTALVLALAIKTRRTLESVVAGAIFAFLIMDGINFVESLADASLQVLRDEQIAWIILVCAHFTAFSLRCSFEAVVHKRSGICYCGRSSRKRVAS
jgi:hypothetical protein